MQTRTYFRVSELLHGIDEVFIRNAYCALLKCWPDNDGFDHYKYMIAGKWPNRFGAIEAISTSPQGKEVGCIVEFDTDADAQHDMINSNAIAAILAVEVQIPVLEEMARSSAAAFDNLSPNSLASFMELIVQQASLKTQMLESELSQLKKDHALLRNLIEQQLLSPQQHPAYELDRATISSLYSHVQAIFNTQRQFETDIRYVTDGFDSLHHFATSKLPADLVEFILSIGSLTLRAATDGGEQK